MASLRYLNSILTVLTALLALQLWTTWSATGPSLTPQAHAAGIPDTGAQNQQIIDQLKLLNQKTDEIKGMLASGKLRFIVAGEEKR